MKQLFLFLILLPLFAAGQGNTTTVSGKVISNIEIFKKLSYSSIWYEYDGKPDTESNSFYVNEKGFFKITLPKNIQVTFLPFFENYYRNDTIINTGNKNELEIVLKLKPKIYVYSEATALQDIKKGKIQIVTNDTLLYNWNQKLHYTKKFRFDYVLVDYEDLEFSNNMVGYNFKMREYIDTFNDSLWYKRLLVTEDSLKNIDADSYTKKHRIKLSGLKVPPYSGLPKKMKDALKFQKLEMDEMVFEFEDYTVKMLLNNLDHSKDYNDLFAMDYFIIKHYEKMIPELIKRLTNKTETGLINSADLMIWERIDSGDLKLYDHGNIVDDDVFKIAGRANHLLKVVTGEYFGSVSMYSTDADLKKLQNRWAYWLLQLQDKK